MCCSFLFFVFHFAFFFCQSQWLSSSKIPNFPSSTSKRFPSSKSVIFVLQKKVNSQHFQYFRHQNIFFAKISKFFDVSVKDFRHHNVRCQNPKGFIQNLEDFRYPNLHDFQSTNIICVPREEFCRQNPQDFRCQSFKHFRIQNLNDIFHQNSPTFSSSNKIQILEYFNIASFLFSSVKC